MQTVLIINGFVLIILVFSIYLSSATRQKKRLMKMAREMEHEWNRLNATLSSMGEGLMVVNTRADVLMMNQAAATLLRIPPQDAEGKPIDSVLRITVKDKSYDIKTELEQLMQSINQIRVGVTDDYVMYNKSDMSFPVTLTITPLLQKGTVAGAIIIFHDISREREIDKAKNEFVAFASHQLRTPLGSMRWNMELLIEGGFGEISREARDALFEMHRSNHFLINLVNELLDVSKIESGHLQDHPEEMEVLPIIKTIVSGLQSTADMLSVKVSVKSDSGLPTVWVDKKRFILVIENLIANAIKYNKKDGQVEIKVSKNNEAILIEVKDTGIGIPEDDQKKIFNKFYRASNAAVGSVQGTGLGLFMVKSFVQRLNGKIWYTSKEGEGTTFFISLPFFNNNFQSGSQER